MVRRFFEFLNQQNVKEIKQLVSNTNYSLHFSGMRSMDWRESMEFLIPFNNAFPDLRREIEGIRAEGNKVAVRLKVTGTHKGEFHGVAPTSKNVSFVATDILTIIDGKILEEWSTADMMGLMKQIGAISVHSSADDNNS